MRWNVHFQIRNFSKTWLRAWLKFGCMAWMLDGQLIWECCFMEEGVWMPEAAEALLSSRSLFSRIPWLTIWNLYTWSIQPVRCKEDGWEGSVSASTESLSQPSQTKFSPRDDYLESGVCIITQIPDWKTIPIRKPDWIWLEGPKPHILGEFDHLSLDI